MKETLSCGHEIEWAGASWVDAPKVAARNAHAAICQQYANDRNRKRNQRRKARHTRPLPSVQQITRDAELALQERKDGVADGEYGSSADGRHIVKKYILGE